MPRKLTKEKIKALFGRILEAFDTNQPATVAGILGLERQSVYPWRDGRTSPSLDNLILISEKTGVSLDWLILGKASPTDIAPFDSVIENLLNLYGLLEEDRRKDFHPLLEGIILIMKREINSDKKMQIVRAASIPDNSLDSESANRQAQQDQRENLEAVKRHHERGRRRRPIQ